MGSSALLPRERARYSFWGSAPKFNGARPNLGLLIQRAQKHQPPLRGSGRAGHLKTPGMWFPWEKLPWGCARQSSKGCGSSGIRSRGSGGGGGGIAAEPQPRRKDAWDLSNFRPGAPEPGGEPQYLPKRECRGSGTAKENPLPALPWCHRHPVSERLVTAEASLLHSRACPPTQGASGMLNWSSSHLPGGSLKRSDSAEQSAGVRPRELRVAMESPGLDFRRKRKRKGIVWMGRGAGPDGKAAGAAGMMPWDGEGAGLVLEGFCSFDGMLGPKKVFFVPHKTVRIWD